MAETTVIQEKFAGLGTRKYLTPSKAPGLDNRINGNDHGKNYQDRHHKLGNTFNTILHTCVDDA